jgi:hypothetical protein
MTAIAMDAEDRNRRCSGREIQGDIGGRANGQTANPERPLPYGERGAPGTGGTIGGILHIEEV